VLALDPAVASNDYLRPFVDQMLVQVPVNISSGRQAQSSLGGFRRWFSGTSSSQPFVTLKALQQINRSLNRAQRKKDSAH
jgi:hypothetical protein